MAQVCYVSYCPAGRLLIIGIRQHQNTNPITKEPLTPSDLISLNYSRKEATGEIHDPISFKPFSEHSHIVAIATTGNVFLAESVKGGKDLVSDTPFKKYVHGFGFWFLLICWHRSDVITLQNPHGLPPASVPNAAALEKTKTAAQAAVAKPLPSPAVSSLKSKEPIPCMCSQYLPFIPANAMS
jgi:peptidyl-prolyl cis-trans isomerase-like protein 2